MRTRYQFLKPAVSNLFGTRDWFRGDSFSLDGGRAGGGGGRVARAVTQAMGRGR